MTLCKREIKHLLNCKKTDAAFLIFSLAFLFASSATAQFNDAASAVESGAGARHTPNASSAAPAENNAASAVGHLELVVALFRHGVRSPLKDMDSQYSGKPWPSLAEWQAESWGGLTRQGTRAATALGASYGTYYLRVWPAGFKVTLWADVDDRTLATAEALQDGLKSKGVPAEIKSVPVPFAPGKRVDLLFHPFEAKCGTPKAEQLQAIVGHINDNDLGWLNNPARSSELTKLYAVLACNPDAQPARDADACKPLKSADDKASIAEGKSSPIEWTGKFSFASTATEAFLLEYADAMPPEKVGWGGVVVGTRGAGRYELSDLLSLHEFYFQQIDRQQYLAQIGGSNLLRELLDQINKKAGYKSPVDGQCPRQTDDSEFVGFVGHDTNLAFLNALLGVEWKFDDPGLPPSLRGIPKDDALPAGALVFELRKGTGSPGTDRVRIQYVTQSLDEMKNAPEKDEPAPFRVRTTCHDAANHELSPCEMTIESFNNVVEDALRRSGPFLSKCVQHAQSCQ